MSLHGLPTWASCWLLEFSAPHAKAGTSSAVFWPWPEPLVTTRETGDLMGSEATEAAATESADPTVC